MTSVWPALWPPWKRTTTSARSLSQSTILPLPSSPHWAPITATLAICEFLTCERLRGGVPGGVRVHSMRGPEGEADKGRSNVRPSCALGTHAYASFPDRCRLHGLGGVRFRIVAGTGAAAWADVGKRPGIAAS